MSATVRFGRRLCRATERPPKCAQYLEIGRSWPPPGSSLRAPLNGRWRAQYGNARFRRLARRGMELVGGIPWCLVPKARAALPRRHKSCCALCAVEREESMPAERFDFPNAQGQKLAALLDRPVGEPRAYALFAHCFTCGKDVRAAKRVAEGLTALGIAVLRFDFTGLGSSEAEFANTTFSSNVGDLVAAANELRRRAQAPAILIGHSLGGTAVLAAAAEVAEARAVVTIAAPCDPTHVTGLFNDRLE